jgi:hypothetical protein
MSRGQTAIAVLYYPATRGALLGIEGEDRLRLRGVAPRHPSIAAAHLHDILVTEIDALVEDPRFVALGVNAPTISGGSPIRWQPYAWRSSVGEPLQST